MDGIVIKLPGKQLTNMLMSLTLAGPEQYISEFDYELERYTVTATSPLSPTAMLIWDALIEELVQRGIGSLVSIRHQFLFAKDAMAELQDVLIYHYFPGGFNILNLFKSCRLHSDVIVCEFEPKLIDFLRSK